MIRGRGAGAFGLKEKHKGFCFWQEITAKIACRNS